MKTNELVGSVEFQMAGGPVERFEFSFSFSSKSVDSSDLIQAARIQLSWKMNCNPGSLVLFPESLSYSTF